MVQAGVFDEHERFELIGGEIVPMNAKGIQHEILKAALNVHFVHTSPDAFRVVPETTFRLSEDTFVEPDFVFFRKTDGLANLSPATALLAVEVADTSLRWDLGRKALIYAQFGIPELWVIDAIKRTTHVHRSPRMEGYAVIRKLRADETAASASIPGLELTIDRLERF